MPLHMLMLILNTERKNLTKFIRIYLFLNSIVGDDDGGKLFTPEEYEAYKRRVLPMVGIDILHQINIYLRMRIFSILFSV
jgi:hypothetical protein